jgi:3-dehydroquinate synthase
LSVTANLLEIKSGLKNYKVHFAGNTDFLSELIQIKNSLFIIDKNLWELHKESSLKALKNIGKIIIEIDEDKKNLETVQNLYDAIIKLSPKKNLVLISVGGGILQDITGFIASTLYRGVKWIFLPSTLLAQDDSCIGAKTSLNYKKYKNLIGTFFAPAAIYIYFGFLKTQKIEDFASGVGEMAKLHLIGGESDVNNFMSAIDKIFALDETVLFAAIKRCLAIKKSFIEEDEFDTARRNLLNYGHCFGHAIESSTNFAVPHGQAVVLGMIIANLVAKSRSLLSAKTEEFVRQKVLNPIIKIDLSGINFDRQKIIEAMGHDKKNTGSDLALILMKTNYKFFKTSDITRQEALAALEAFEKLRTCP